MTVRKKTTTTDRNGKRLSVRLKVGCAVDIKKIYNSTNLLNNDVNPFHFQSEG